MSIPFLSWLTFMFSPRDRPSFSFPAPNEYQRDTPFNPLLTFQCRPEKPGSAAP
jgi:hypothetical protein